MSVSWGTVAGNALAVAAEALAVFTALLVVWVRYADEHFAAQPVRSAFRSEYGRLAWKHWGRTSWWDVWVVRWRLIKALKRWRGPAFDDVAIFADVICRSKKSASELPYRTARFEVLSGVVAIAVQRRRVGLVVRYLVADQWAYNRAFLVLLNDYCAQFRALQTVSYPKWPVGQRLPLGFPDAVSAMTGAVVIADMSARNSGSADRVIAWHSRDWRGHDWTDGKARSGLFERPYVRYRSRNQIVAPSLVRYNGRVPILLGVEVAQPGGSDGAVMVLHTAESDYLSTEPLSPGALTRRCKKLTALRTDAALEKFELLGGKTDQTDRRIGARVKRSGEVHRETLLNGKVALVSVVDGEASFVLMQRSFNVSNGAGGLAQTSGGVAELAVEGDRRDADPFGAVDVLAAIRRELHEELGIRPNDCNLSAKAVFLANSRTKPVHLGRLDTGELVATVLAIGTTTLDPAGFALRRLEGSQSRGLYESEGLVFVPMGKSAQEFAENLLKGTYDRSDSSWCPVGGGLQIENELEQAAVVAALYASEMRYGQEETIDAFKTVAGGVPWWSRPWEGRGIGARARIVRDPARLVSNAADETSGERGPFEQWVEDLWGKDLDRLLRVFWEECDFVPGKHETGGS